MTYFIGKDTDVNDYIKYAISSYKGIPATDINIIDYTVNPDDEYGAIRLRYSYKGSEDVVSVSRQPLHTIMTFKPEGGNKYKYRDGVMSLENISSWDIVKNSETICDILDIPKDDVNVTVDSVNLFSSGLGINLKISAKENSYYLCSDINVSIRHPYNAQIAERENIRHFMPKIFRHDYVDEYIKLYDTYPDGIPSEKLVELENAKIESAGRESYFIRGEEYNPDRGEEYYKYDESRLIGTLFENYLLGTKTGGNIYTIAGIDYRFRDWGYEGEAGYSLFVVIRTDGNLGGNSGSIISRRLDLRRDLVPVMPKKGFKRFYTNDKSVRNSMVSGLKGSYYIDSIAHLGSSKFKLRLDQAYRRLVYYSGVQRKDSYSEEELASLKSTLKTSIEHQLYNVYSLPVDSVKLILDDFEKTNYDMLKVKAKYSAAIVGGEIPIDIIYEK